MMRETISMLYIDHNPAERKHVHCALKTTVPDLVIVDIESPHALVAYLTARWYDLVLAYFTSEADFNAMPIAELVQNYAAQIPLLIVTNPDLEYRALEALHHGAADYLIKTAEYLRHLPCTIRTLVERQRMRNECHALRTALQQAQVNQEHPVRRRAEVALHTEQHLLLQRVTEHTADLSTANAELLRAMRLKDEFLASVSHELRTPLNAILGMAGVLQEEVYGILNDQQQGALQQIEVSGQRLLNIINDMIDLSKIRAGKSPLIISNVALKAVCQASLALFQQEIQQKRLHVALEYDDAVQTLHADEHRLKQILFNLLSNAVKFTPESGTIGLQVAGDTAGHAVYITVWDTGIGIAAEDIAYLFQPFVQLDGRLSKAYGGTGLGLALLYCIVKMHGGCVTVTSSPGMGSCFTIALPWSTDMPPTGEMSVQEDDNADTGAILNWPQTLRRPGMLIAESNESQLAHLSQHFLAAGYQVVVARNGSEAMARAHEMRPDILVLSVHMPDVDGLEIIRRIRADNTLRTTFIIALTSLAVPGEHERYLAAGVNAYFKHPVHLATMIAIIEVHLHHVRRIPVEVEGR